MTKGTAGVADFNYHDTINLLGVKKRNGQNGRSKEANVYRDEIYDEIPVGYFYNVKYWEVDGQ